MADQQPTLQPSNADSSTRTAPEKSKKKLKSSTVKDAISKTRTVTGGSQDQININPIQEDAGKHAVIVPGRFQPPTAGGHEMMIRKAEAHAKSIGADTHIVASHSEGSGKNPIPLKAKVGYLQKIAGKDTKVASYSKEHPNVYHYLSHLHSQGVKHVTIMAGEDRQKEYENVKKYNGKEGPHGHFNFKSINVVSAGHRDPDAEGSAGVSGTKIRELARSGGGKAIKPHLPKAIQSHANEIAKHISSVNEDVLDIDDAFDFFFFAEEKFGKNREAVSRSGQDRKEMDLVVRKGEDRKEDDRPYRQQSIMKKIIDEAKKSAWERMLDKNPKFKRSEERAQEAKDALQQNAKDYQAILDKEKKAKKDVKESTSTSDIPVWEKPGPKSKSKKMTPEMIAKAKARAKANGRRYPNLIDNMAVMKE